MYQMLLLPVLPAAISKIPMFFLLLDVPFFIFLRHPVFTVQLYLRWCCLQSLSYGYTTNFSSGTPVFSLLLSILLIINVAHGVFFWYFFQFSWNSLRVLFPGWCRPTENLSAAILSPHHQSIQCYNFSQKAFVFDYTENISVVSQTHPYVSQSFPRSYVYFFRLHCSPVCSTAGETWWAMLSAILQSFFSLQYQKIILF